MLILNDTASWLLLLLRIMLMSSLRRNKRHTISIHANITIITSSNIIWIAFILLLSIMNNISTLLLMIILSISTTTSIVIASSFIISSVSLKVILTASCYICRVLSCICLMVLVLEFRLMLRYFRMAFTVMWSCSHWLSAACLAITILPNWIVMTTSHNCRCVILINEGCLVDRWWEVTTNSWCHMSLATTKAIMGSVMRSLHLRGTTSTTLPWFLNIVILTSVLTIIVLLLLVTWWIAVSINLITIVGWMAPSLISLRTSGVVMLPIATILIITTVEKGLRLWYDLLIIVTRIWFIAFAHIDG